MLWQGVKPFGDLFAFFAVFQAAVDLLADFLGQPRNFPFSRHTFIFWLYLPLLRAGMPGVGFWRAGAIRFCVSPACRPYESRACPPSGSRSLHFPSSHVRHVIRGENLIFVSAPPRRAHPPGYGPGHGVSATHAKYDGIGSNYPPQK